MRRGKGTVVFIGSCSYSGSTVLELMMGAADGGRALGELGRAFLPQQKHHVRRECGCLNPKCTTWEGIFEPGPRNIHDRIIESDNVTHLIDSTKDPHWIADRSKEILELGHQVKNVLIWKHPEDLRKSYQKRGIEKYWRRHWVNYHRLYFSMINDFIIIPFNSLIGKEGDLEERLNKIDIQIERKFWKGRNCSLFGNDSAKRHLHEIGSPGHGVIQTRRSRDIGEGENVSHRSVEEKIKLPEEYGGIQGGKVSMIVSFLENNDSLLREGSVSNYPQTGSLRFGPMSCEIRRYHQIIKSIIPKIRWSRGA